LRFWRESPPSPKLAQVVLSLKGATLDLELGQRVTWHGAPTGERMPARVVKLNPKTVEITLVNQRGAVVHRRVSPDSLTPGNEA
jgi:hypothetical protein